MKEVMIPNGSIAVEAKYIEQVISDYRGNPFIEALPHLISPHEVIEKIAVYPKYHKSERQIEGYYRIHMIDRLFQVFQPLPMSLELENKISRALRQGYISRNPFDRKLGEDFYNEYHKGQAINLTNIDEDYSSPLGFSLIGISGIGKTASLNRIINLYPQIIVHSKYKDIPLSMYQVVWLKLECPFDGSIKGLIYEFFAEIDRLLGTNYYEKVMRARATVDAMMVMMGQVVRNSSLGLLIIDEIQHLSMAKSGGSEKMLNFFVTLGNAVGIPLVLVGTPKAINVLQGDFRQARRGSGSGGDMVCNRIQKDEVWDLLIKSIWHYQWTRTETPLTDELSGVMYEETQGIPDLVKKVYAIAQAYAINTGKEKITSQIIRKVAKENLKLVQPMITALKTNNIREIAKFDDINLMEINFKDTITRTKESIKLDLKVKEMMNKGKKIKQDNLNEEKKNSSSVNARSEVKTVQPNKVERKAEGRKEKDNQVDLNSEDIRFIVEQGKNDNKSAYESLKKVGYIISFESDIFSKEVLE